MMPVSVATAEYTPSTLPELAGNPYAEALPPLRPDRDVIKALRVLPEFTPGERELPGEDRVAASQRLLRCVVPTRQYLEVYRKLHRLLCSGYVERNPLSPETVRWHYDLARNRQVTETSSAESMVVCGISGAGKTTLVRSILRCMPQVIEHDAYDGAPFERRQLVYVCVDVPADASRRALCLGILDAIDRALGTGHGREYRKPRTSVDDMQHAIKTLFGTYGVAVLLVDEFQNLSLARAGGRQALLQFFDSLVNEVRVPVVQIGTPAAIRVYEDQFRSARRAGTGGHVEIDRIKPGSEEWRILIQIVWQRQWVRRPAELTQKLDDLVYDLTQGLPACVFRLFALAHEAAISDGSERIDAQLLKRVYKEQFGLMRHALQQLRRGRSGAYEDLVEGDRFIASGGAAGSIRRITQRVKHGQFAPDLCRELLTQIRDVECEFDLTPNQEREIVRLKGVMGDALQGANHA